MGTGEITGNQEFIIFPLCFLPFPKQTSAMESKLYWAKIKTWHSEFLQPNFQY